MKWHRLQCSTHLIADVVSVLDQLLFERHWRLLHQQRVVEDEQHKLWRKNTREICNTAQQGGEVVRGSPLRSLLQVRNWIHLVSTAVAIRISSSVLRDRSRCETILSCHLSWQENFLSELHI